MLSLFFMPSLRKVLASLVLVSLFIPNLAVFAASPEPSTSGDTTSASESPAQKPTEQTEGITKPEDALLSLDPDSLSPVKPETPEGDDLTSTSSAITTPEPIFPPIEAVKHGQVTLPSVNAATGALSYTYPFSVPPGIAGMQPDLALSYSSTSQTEGSLVGYSWSLSLPKIERLARHGSDDLYAFADFSSTFSGELSPLLVDASQHGSYGARVDDGSRLSYVFDADGSWIVTDKQGKQYVFGAGETARLENPEDVTQVAAWYLTEISDMHDNTVHFFYEKNGGQVYPSQIVYTNHGAEEGAFEILFAREARPDHSTSFATGFPVTTDQRITTITTTVNDIPVRVFTLSYEAGDNGMRSLLSSITETAFDEDGGPSITLPATTFSYSASSRSWTEVPVSVPVSFSCVCAARLGVEVVDVNGDALPDIVRSTETLREVYLNSGSQSWVLDPSWTVPVAFVSAVGWDHGVRFADVNGDGLQDLLSASSASGPYDPSMGAVYLNSGSGWTLDTSWSIPIAISGNYDFGVRIFDADGDSLPDIVSSRRAADLTITSEVYLNTGVGWELDTGYVIPVGFVTESLVDNGVRTVDVNADGLIDLIHAQMTTSGLVEEVYVHQGNGTGWVEDPGYAVPEGFTSSTRRDRGLRAQDVNADGLPDLFLARNSSTVLTDLYLHRGDGTGWVEDPTFSAPFVFTSDGGLDFGVRMVDVNGDLIEDALISRNNASDLTQQLFLGRGSRADLLQGVQTSFGGSLEIGYTSVTEQGGDLWFPVQTVSSVTSDDGLGGRATTSYTYEDGFYARTDAWDRKFAGFGLVSTTDALGQVTREYFHQGNDTNAAQGESEDHVSKMGRRYRQEIFDASGNLFTTTIDTWTRTALDALRDQVVRTQTLSLEYDGDSDHRDRAMSWVYDSISGNLSQTTSWGEVLGEDTGTFTDMGSDALETSFLYADWPSGQASGFVSEETLVDGGRNTLRHTQSFYDGLPLGSVSLGDETSESAWVTGSTYATTTASYDPYGFLTNVADPRGNATTFSPDIYHRAPAGKTNALGHTETFLYDDSSGAVREMTDVNGFRFVRDLDALDREIIRWQPDAITPTTLVISAQTAYTDTIFPLRATRTEVLSSLSSRMSTTVVDGFLRSIQTKQTHDLTSWRTTDTTYDALGRIAVASLPYLTTTQAWTPRTTDITLLTSFTYDALGRVTHAAHLLGEVSHVYDGWQETVTDENGHAKGLLRDAADRLVAVEEQNGSAVYTTSYLWNGRGDLLRITDALGNVRNFTYDGLSRRLRAEDLHASADRSFGVWTYLYDLSGNMIRETNPKAQITNVTYDALNRVLTEDATSTSGVDVTYVYDSCTQGLGKLCRIAMPSAVGATTNYIYDALGRVGQEAKTIASTTYTTTTSFDRQGNPLEVTLPDTSRYGYTYDAVGNLVGMTYRDIPTSTNPSPIFVPVVTDVVYAPIGTPSAWTSANGLRTLRTFDSTEEYRLTRIRTTPVSDLASSTPLTDLTYTYDAKGNILMLTDASATARAKITTYTYDDLDRLLTATVTAPVNGDDTSWAWSYDALGSRVSETQTFTDTTTGLPVVTTQTSLYRGHIGTNFANPHAATTIGSATQTYDRSGNLTSDGTQTYAWNADGRLTKSVRGSSTTSYFYDQAGSRIKIRRGTVTTVYPNSFYNVQGNTRVKHLFLGEIPVATMTTQGTSTLTTTPRYLLTDHLQSTVASTTATGAVDELLDYHPYGTSRITLTSSVQEQRTFAGSEGDRAEGLSYMQARYYHPAQGRFVSQDPLFLDFNQQGSGNLQQQSPDFEFDQRKNVQSDGESTFGWSRYLTEPKMQNSYNYSHNNPLVYIDPNGENAYYFSFDVNGGIAAEAGGSVTVGFATDGTFGMSLSGHAGGLAGLDFSAGLSVGYSRGETWKDTLGSGEYVQVGGKLAAGFNGTANFSDGNYTGAEVGAGLGIRATPSLPPIPVVFSAGVEKTESVATVVKSVVQGVQSGYNTVKDTAKNFFQGLW